MAQNIIKLLRELFVDNGLEQYDLQISEDEGLVRLSGSVENWAEVVRAGHLAGAIKGVRSVVNEISAATCAPPPYAAPQGNNEVIGRADVVIIGAGIVGSAIARELSRFELTVVVLEKEADVACGASKANNGMVHSGIVQEPDSLRSKLNLRGNALFEDLCRELDVPFQRCNLAVVMLKEEELFLLDLLKARGEMSGIPVELISGEKLNNLEPSLSPEIKGALLAPTTAMTCPYKLNIAYAENAIVNGAGFYLNTEVTALEQKGGALCKVITTQGSFLTGCCINAAGVYAGRIAEMAGPPEFTIHPRKGELIIFDREAASGHAAVATGILEMSRDPHTKGGGTMLTVDGNPEWGPTAMEVSDPEDTAVTAEGLSRILDKFGPLLPGFEPRRSIISFFAGVRAATYTEDFHIAPSGHLKGLFHVAGIQSPGLAAAPAIAELVLQILEDEGIALREKTFFNPQRREPPPFSGLSLAEQNRLIGKDRRYGHVVCRCEQITEKEVVDALHRPLPARTLDAVKRRTRAGMGRCQGGFCLPRLLSIMSEELEIPMEKLTKSGPGSPLFSRRTKEDPCLKEGSIQ